MGKILSTFDIEVCLISTVEFQSGNRTIDSDKDHELLAGKITPA